jgi:hypothetical protein
MNDGEWSYVREQFNGLRDDIKEVREAVKDMRAEMQTTFMRHDASDNARFGELFERLRPLEIAVGIQEHMDAHEIEAEHKKHGWAVTRMLTLGTLFGGAGAELLHQIFALFTQRGH